MRDRARQRTDTGAARTGDAGFTLLEVLVAFVIVLIALAVLYQGVAGGLQATEIAARYESALSRAASHLAAASVPGQLRAGEQSGDDGGGFSWRASTRVLDQAAFVGTPPEAARTAPQAALYGIDVTISWREDGRARQVTLKTEREATAGARAP